MRLHLALVLALAACAEFPDLDVPGLDAAEQSAYPQLLPMTQLLARADAPQRFSQAEAEALLARARGVAGVAARGADPASAARLARLRARAEILHGPLATEADIERMRQALARIGS